MHDEYNPNITDPIEIPIPHKENGKENEPVEANEPVQNRNEEHLNGDDDNVDDDDQGIGNQQMQF